MSILFQKNKTKHSIFKKFFVIFLLNNFDDFVAAWRIFWKILRDSFEQDCQCVRSDLSIRYWEKCGKYGRMKNLRTISRSINQSKKQAYTHKNRLRFFNTYNYKKSIYRWTHIMVLYIASLQGWNPNDHIIFCNREYT